MKNLLEIHILQNFAPSNLNRDDTGSPKDAYFGGYRRGRISSQCLKRAAREYIRENNLISVDNMALRTKRISSELVKLLVVKGREEQESLQKAIAALGGVGLKVKDIEEGKIEYLVFLGQDEISRIAELINQHWDELAVPAKEEGEKKKGKAAKKEAKAAIPNDLKKALAKVLDGGKAVDVALFGRMLADLPQANQEAACQVAHAISTSVLEREFDFYTAVDDLKPDDNSGADMLGTIEFGSSCFYRYIALDIEKLLNNLQNDTELMEASLKEFIKAIIKAKPSGKQNSFAAHNDPEYVVITARKDADPRNLANAFEKPVRTKRDQSLTGASAVRLEQKWRWLNDVYGQTGNTYYYNSPEIDEHDFKCEGEQATNRVGEPVSNLDELIEKSLSTIKVDLGG